MLAVSVSYHYVFPDLCLTLAEPCGLTVSDRCVSWALTVSAAVATPGLRVTNRGGGSAAQL